VKLSRLSPPSVSACTSTYNRCGKNYDKTKIIISKKKILYERKAKTDKYKLFIEFQAYNVNKYFSTAKGFLK